MMQSSAKGSVYPQKIVLAIFIFALVILAGKIIFSQFNSFSGTYAASEADSQLAAMLQPEFFQAEAIKTGKIADPGLALYRAELSRPDVLWFYSHIVGNETLARIVLVSASQNNIPPPLAFALAWEESRFQPKAVNRNVSSIDRGLFQLNNLSFPKLTEKDFFNPETNAAHGLAHLNYCIDYSGNEVAALAMYNAGTTKVSKDGTPKRTLDYISRIISFREGLEKLFEQEVASRYTVAADNTVTLKK